MASPKSPSTSMFARIFGRPKKVTPPREATNIKVAPKGGRSSAEDTVKELDGLYTSFSKKLDIVKPPFVREFIPLIRKLTMVNEDISQALHNTITLGNTDHELTFDSTVSGDQAMAMRAYIKDRKTPWMGGIRSINSMVNRLMSQSRIAGAICFECYPSNHFDGVRVVLINPEDIYLKYNRSTDDYDPYQRVRNTVVNGEAPSYKLRPLNKNTFYYDAVNGDNENPYGYPPYLPSLVALEDQEDMLINLQVILKQVGLFGFLQILADKPMQDDGESDEKYRARLTAFLQTVKNNSEQGFKDGILASYRDDMDFEFHAPSKNLTGIDSIVSILEKRVASGLKSDPMVMGKGGNRTEAGSTIVFTKLISELSNLQKPIAEALAFIYDMDLRMKGFKFNSVSVKFNPSTLQDSLKYQQAQELKVRNYSAMYWDGIITLDEYARAMGYPKAVEKEPLMNRYMNNTAVDGAAEDKAQGKENDSEKKQRRKSKPQDKSVK